MIALLLVSAAAAAAGAGDRATIRSWRAGQPGAPEVRPGILRSRPTDVSLLPGSGDARGGAALYAAKCAHCHGASGREGPDPPLVGGMGTLAGSTPLQTVGSYWPYATTVYDYIQRAMPFLAPGSLSDAEVYAVTAFLLHQNGIVADNFSADRRSLPAVEMPNRHGFVPDPRPEQFNRRPERARAGE